MDMSFDITALGPLFEMSRDPVLGVLHGIICFANPAASTLFSCKPGDSADTLLPPEVLSVPERPYHVRLSLAGLTGDLTLTQMEDLTLVIFVPTDPDPLPGWNAALREMANTLFFLQVAMDGLITNSQAEDDPQLKDHACRLYQNYYRLKRMHNHLSTAASLRQNTLYMKLQPVDMTQLCYELCQTVDILVREKDIQVAFAASNEDMTVEADPNWMEILLLNLLSNSLSHVEPGSRVLVSLSRQGRRVLLAVSDRGCGMEPELVDALFSGDLPTRPMDGKNGAGLGLVIVRGLAQRFGGTLMLESHPRQGTTFRLSLPVIEPAKCAVATPEYRQDGMNNVLTELSNVLDKSLYTQKLMD
jgi:signal transduction histidine kinase